ncbi:MAG: hypothetical protein HN417_11110, partial [Desulfobacula sp.]|nr:hypothetical protein [Desulfobacula sp.]
MDTDHDRSIFFGREEESELVFHKIAGQDLLVLFAKSGMGKSSLLNAGVMQKLREKNLIPFSIRLNNTEKSPLESIYTAIEETVKRTNIEYYEGKKDRLWTYFKTAEFWSDDSERTPVLIFDQFEELFTLDHSFAGKEDFIAQLSELTVKRMPKSLREQQSQKSGTDETSPEVKIVIVIREDYLAYLDEMSQKIPNILENRFRLLPLSRERAAAAIEKPAALKNEELGSAAFKYHPQAIKAMMDFLCTRHERGKEIIGDEVESFQLQLL